MNPRNPIQFWILQGALVATAILCSAPLKARSAPAADPVQTIKLYLERATAGLPGRIEIGVGTLDERLKLAPCAQVEPYVPAGARLWGKTSIGLRCLDAAAWNVFLPVNIRVFVPALVAARQLLPGQLAQEGDVLREEVELTREAGTVVTQLAQIEGKLLSRALAAGQALKQDHFRAPPAVNAGDAVQVVYTGSGFSISTNGRAMSPAADGQPVRVQTDSGRMVQGTARQGRIVELK